MGKGCVANIGEGGESDIDQGKTEFEVEEKKVRHNTSDGLTK